MAEPLPDGTHLAYTVYHESYWWQGMRPEVLPNEGRPTVQIAASAKGAGGGVAWDFGIVEYRGIGLKLGIFNDAWPAFRQLPEFFTALALGGVTSLEDVIDLLGQLGAADETERTLGVTQ